MNIRCTSFSKTFTLFDPFCNVVKCISTTFLPWVLFLLRYFQYNKSIFPPFSAFLRLILSRYKIRFSNINKQKLSKRLKQQLNFSLSFLVFESITFGVRFFVTSKIKKNNLIFLPTTLVQVATTDSFKSLEKWLLVYKNAIFFLLRIMCCSKAYTIIVIVSSNVNLFFIYLFVFRWHFLD